MGSRSSVVVAMAMIAQVPAGCGGTPAALPAHESSGTGAGGDGGGPSSQGGSGGAFVPGGVVTTYEATIGPMPLEAGSEETRCILVRLDNPEKAFARRLRTTLADGAHHFIVYTSNETIEDPVPEPCKGFSGFLDGEHPIFIAQHAHTDLVFPTEGGEPVGLALEPHQMVRLEMHTLNASPGPLDVTGTVAVDTVPAEAGVIPADIAFWGTTHLDAGGDPPSDAIPPNAAGDTGLLFQAALAGTRIFALTTHQHWLAKRMRVWLAAGPGQTSELLTDTGEWSDPPLELFDPPIAFAPGAAGQLGPAGLSYRCEWLNTTPDPVPFGESAVKNEMCFLWHFYYPAQGFHYCIDGKCS